MLVSLSQNTVLGEVDSLPILDFTGLVNSPIDADPRVSTEQRNGAHGAWECLLRLLGRPAPRVQPLCYYTLHALCTSSLQMECDDRTEDPQARGHSTFCVHWIMGC